MLLYKNVDICDLESILKNGILSMDACGNNNWDEGKRSDNDTSVVYLFSPSGVLNSFPKYGVALLECECDAAENAMSELDVHKNDYTEYITDKVEPSQIKRIIIPALFRSRITVPENADITWCGLEATVFDDGAFRKASASVLKQFAETAELSEACFNFFRGQNADRTIIDLEDVRYIF